jgi:transposase
VSRLEPTLEPERAVRRIEVITGAGGRRRRTLDDKTRIVEETLERGASVSEFARRHGLTPQQLFGWQREARKRSEASAARGPSFVPAMVELA